MIETIKIHDKFAFDIKFGYKTAYQAKENQYIINTYIFAPSSLDINRRTYQKEDFYKDIKSSIRFIPPSILLRNFCLDDNRPLQVLKEAMTALANEPSPQNADNFRFTLKMYCSVLKSSVRDEVFLIEKESNPEDLSYLTRYFIKNLQDSLDQYRAQRKLINVPNIEKKVLSIFSYGDEYLSNVLYKYAHRLINILNSKAIGDYKALSDELLGMIKYEGRYRFERQYPLVTNEAVKNEEFVYRRSVLKKFMENELQLHTFIKKDRQFLQQLVYSLAAGIAMVFATLVAFWSQMWYGNMTAHFFVILVVSYMLKDRIKELVRFYFSGKMNKFAFDNRSKIFSDNGQNIGFYRESFDFIEQKSVPEEILKIRNKEHITDIENEKIGEQVLIYRKQTAINPELIRKTYYDFEMQGIEDITRYNIAKFTSKMDDPEVPLYIPKGDLFKFTLADRIYHINLIIHFNAGIQDFYKRYRIVLNRNGIKRIEPIGLEP
jgi:hypothetical protein